MKPLLSIVQEACYEVGVYPPSSIVNNSDPAAKLLLCLANDGLDELKDVGNWPQLTKTGSITLVASQSTYPVPSDWERNIADTLWSESDKWPLGAPLTSDEWMARQYGFTTSPIRTRYRISGRRPNFEITPTPTSEDAGKKIFYEYISNQTVSTVASTYRNAFEADTDMPVLDDKLIRDEIIWRLRRQKGLEYASFQMEAARNARSKLIETIGYGRINLLQRKIGQRFIDSNNIPDSVEV